MSLLRISGDDGVIIDSTKFLELPKSPEASPVGDVLRPGMIRYNTELNSFEGVIDSDAGSKYRRFPNLDQNGKLLITQLPDGIASGLVYKGTFNPITDDIDPPSVAGVYTALPASSDTTNGQYYIVRGLMNAALVHYKANTPTTSPVTFTPANANGTATWLEVKYYFNESGNILGAFGRITDTTLSATTHPGFSTLFTDTDLLSFSTTDSLGNELALADGDWLVCNDTAYTRIRESRVSILASSVSMSSTQMDNSGRTLQGADAGTAQTYIDGLLLGAIRRGGDSMVQDGSAANGRIAFVYGTAAAPSLTFNSTVFNPDSASGMTPSQWSANTSGIFMPTTNSIGVSSSGTERLRINGTGIIVYQASSVNTSTSAALQLQNSTNTAVAGFTAYSNRLYVTVGGDAQGIFDATGLTVKGTVSSTAANLNGNVTIGVDYSNTLTVNSTTTHAAPVILSSTLTANGNVVLGDASTDTLTVNAASTFAGSVALNGNVILGDASDDTITFNGSTSFAATAPVTMNGNLTVKGNTIIGDALADTLTVTSTSTFSSPVTFTGNVVVGDASTDTLTVTSTSTFASPVTFNGNVVIGDSSTDTLNVTSASTFVNSVSMNSNVTIGDDASDVIAIKGTTSVTAPLTLTNTTLTLAGTTSAVLSKVSTGVQLALAASTEEFLLKGSTTTLASIGNYGVVLPVVDTSTATVKVGAVAYDSTKGGVYAGVGTSWVNLSNPITKTAFTATWTTDSANSEIYYEAAVSGAVDAAVYETKSGYVQKRTDVTVRVYPTTVRIVLPSTGTAFAGTLVTYK